MVALFSKTEIDSLNIDTVEKALVFGALVLRAALVGPDDGNADNTNVSLNVSTSTDGTGSLDLEIYLPFSSYGVNTSGGVLLDNIQEYSSNAPNLAIELSLASAPSTSGLVMPNYPESEVATFEKYLMFYAQILWASVEDKNSSPISFSIFGGQDQPQIWIRVSLPLNLDQWLFGANYLDAISTVVTEYVVPDVPNLDPSLFTQSANYSVSFDYPDPYIEMEFLDFQRPTILDAIYFDIYYDDLEGAFDCSFYLNGEEILYQDYSDYGNGTVEIIFDTTNNPTIFLPGDILNIEIYDDEQIAQLDASSFVLELPLPQQ
ncbi:hypothetical protein Xen7305DRAFT_00045400 [Xenococcus sp. PCC 7305]|uniref:hypothetical protein n=1 Tax=Xenococcus sp. PCC 7305 TaxID=102125 RepID=UPI0002AC5F2C|nr:hypothetical protein [Xenococcus sp. PCC 7305]ELS04804.1 hypothetical protein Xen7305DRAFT_00045400 [Xenococcus sp. PCC 7305]